jgi:hypothetical protein
MNVMRRTRAERQKTTMSTAETANTEQAAVVAAQGVHSAPEKAASKNPTSRRKVTAKGPAAAKGKGTTAKPAKSKGQPSTTHSQPDDAPRPRTKGLVVLELLRRTNGASLNEIMKATGWQAHSIRGFMSGTLGTKRGLKIISIRRDDGERIYSVDSSFSV